MSGSKRATVQISEAEYERLRSAELALRSTNPTSRQNDELVHAQSIQAMKTSLEWMTARQADFQKEVSTWNNRIAGVEHKTARHLQDYQLFLVSQVDEHIHQAGQALVSILDQRLHEVQERLDNDHARYQSQLMRLEQKIEAQENNEQAKQQIALEWLESAENLAAFIRSHYQSDFFLPGDLAQLEMQLAQARDNLALHMPEAVFAACQNTYFSLSELRLRLEQLESEWNVLFYAAWEELLKLQALYAENENVQALDLEGGFLSVNINIDFWTDRRWTEAIRQVDAILARFDREDDPYTIDELRAILNNDVPQLSADLEEMIKAARITALNSQLRINIADIVICALTEQGFSLDGANYAGDLRGSYGAKLLSYDGAEVFVRVAPSGNQVGENSLEVHSSDAGIRSEHELYQRWTEIHRSLQQQGLLVSNMQVLKPAVRQTAYALPNRSGVEKSSRRLPSRRLEG